MPGFVSDVSIIVKKITLRSVIFTSYAMILAILVTAYMGNKTYFMNFYILPILFSAYYFGIQGAAVMILLSSALGTFFMCRAGYAAGGTLVLTNIITFTVVGAVAGMFQWENNRLNNFFLQASLTDKLTGLYNYRYFVKRLAEETARSDRYNHPVGLIMIDIDYFKQYNDNYGHQRGNQVLVKMAEIFIAHKRQSDILFRYGGEEFAVVLPETRKGSGEYAERLRQKVADEVFPGGTKITISAGVAWHPYGKNVNKDLIERADKALYQAKLSGRNRVCLFNGMEFQKEIPTTENHLKSDFLVNNNNGTNWP